jgi:prephenate dehydrogenase
MPSRFVPTHPVAGSELSGPEAASEALFDGCTVVLTPESETDASAVGVVQVLWRAVGAATQTMTSADHDRVLSVTSHLPHFLAFAFLDQVDSDMLPFAGGGFRDFTRIAAANPEMWARIFQLNKKALLASLKDFRQAARILETAIRQEDTNEAEAIIRAAAGRRREFDG